MMHTQNFWVQQLLSTFHDEEEREGEREEFTASDNK